MMLMAERLQLSRLWSVCAEILEERHRAFVEMEEARKVAALSRPHLNAAVRPGSRVNDVVRPGTRSLAMVSETGNQRATFLAGLRKRGKIKT